MGIISYMMSQRKSTQSIDSKVLYSIRGKGRGSVHVPGDFLDLGSREAVDLALHRLVQKGVLRRLARGVYDFPQRHPTLGVLSPSAETIATALAGRDRTRLQPAGAYAANALGLSEQVPAKAVFLTDGPSRTVKIGAMTIQLRQTTPRNMAAAGRLSGLVIQAFRELGKEHVTPARIKQLKRTLPADKRRELLKDLKLAPAWMHPLFRDLAEDEQ
jgi:predicted transcriptional regulator of viral defense system